MKKTSTASKRKLAIRRETLRTLNALGEADLARVAGALSGGCGCWSISTGSKYC